MVVLLRPNMKIEYKNKKYIILRVRKTNTIVFGMELHYNRQVKICNGNCSRVILMPSIRIEYMLP